VAFNRGVVAHTMMMMMMMMRERGWGGERETNTSAGQVSRCPGPGEKIRSQTNTRPSLSPRLFGRRAGEKIYSQTNKTSIPRLRLSRKACRCPGVQVQAKRFARRQTNTFIPRPRAFLGRRAGVQVSMAEGLQLVATC
jgi:hypothetical protein